jgi:hypothetical protein
MGVTIETWVVKDPSKIEEHDQFFMRWMNYVDSVLGESSPSCRYYAERNPVGGRVLVIMHNNEEDERKLDKMRVDDATFVKFRDEWFTKYEPQSFVIKPCDEIMYDTIQEIERKYKKT